MALRWLGTSFLFPVGAVYIGLAAVTWVYLTPNLGSMAEFEPGWMFLIWLRNAALLTLFAGGLHWWLYIRKSQDLTYRLEPRWLATNNPKFLWRNQTRDNMFWSLISGCTVWSLFEALTMWAYANEMNPRVEWSESPVYLAVTVVVSFFWGTFHFYVVHRWSMSSIAGSIGARYTVWLTNSITVTSTSDRGAVSPCILWNM